MVAPEPDTHNAHGTTIPLLAAAIFAATLFADARRFVMALSDGDAVSFAMPGYPQATYRFTKAGATVSAAGTLSPSLAAARP